MTGKAEEEEVSSFYHFKLKLEIASVEEILLHFIQKTLRITFQCRTLSYTTLEFISLNAQSVQDINLYLDYKT